MKTLLVLAGVALIGWGVYEYTKDPNGHGKKKKGCGCGSGAGAGPGAGAAGAGASGSGAGAGAGAGANRDGSSGGTIVPVSGAGAGIPGGSASVDDITADGSNPVDQGGVTGAGGGVVVNSPASNSLGGGVNNPWGGNVPDVNNNFVYASQDGGPNNSASYPGMVQRWDASKQATVSPPITTISGIPGGSASVQEMSWDKSVLLVKD